MTPPSNVPFTEPCDSSVPSARDAERPCPAAAYEAKTHRQISIEAAGLSVLLSPDLTKTLGGPGAQLPTDIATTLADADVAEDDGSRPANHFFPRHRRGEVRASRACRCTAARNSGQPAIGLRREDAIERDHRRGRSWPASPNSRGEIAAAVRPVAPDDLRCRRGRSVTTKVLNNTLGVSGCTVFGWNADNHLLAAEVRVDHIPESRGRDRTSNTMARPAVAPLVQECSRSGSRVQVRTGNPLLPKGGERCGNCCVAASCTVIHLSRSPSTQTASCVTR